MKTTRGIYSYLINIRDIIIPWRTYNLTIRKKSYGSQVRNRIPKQNNQYSSRGSPNGTESKTIRQNLYHGKLITIESSIR